MAVFIKQSLGLFLVKIDFRFIIQNCKSYFLTMNVLAK